MTHVQQDSSQNDAAGVAFAQSSEKRFEAPRFLRERAQGLHRFGVTGCLFAWVMMCVVVGLYSLPLGGKSTSAHWVDWFVWVGVLAAFLTTVILTIDDDDPSLGRMHRISMGAFCGGALAMYNLSSLTDVLLAIIAGSLIGAISRIFRYAWRANSDA